MKLASLRRWLPPRVYLWLGLMMAGYFVVALTGTWLNYVELHVNAGGVGLYDLGINQQALASASHPAAPFPLYEATSCGRTARCSLLLTHPIFLAYVIAAPYALAPSAFTLFAFQDAALGLAALPLFAIGRRVLRSDRWALVVTGIYLAWLPPFTGIFSFHWEAFIPLELFTIAYLWFTRRYWMAVPVVLLTYITLEVTPVLLFFFGIFFLWDWILALLRYLAVQTRYLLMPKGTAAAEDLRARLRRVRRGLLKSRAVRATLVLMVGSVAAYLALHEIVQHGSRWIGLPSLPPEYQIPVTQPVHSAGITLATLTFAWQQKLTFWIVIFATLGLIPFLAPRALILAVPWVLYSSITTAGFYRMGDQYAFVTAAVLFLPFVYGLARLFTWARRPDGSPQLRARGDPTSPPSAPPSTSGHRELGPGPADGGSPPAAGDGDSVDRDGPSAATRAAGVPPGVPVVPPTELGPARPGNGSRGTRFYRRIRRSLRPPTLRTAAIATLLAAILAFSAFLNPFDPLASQVRLERPFVDQSGLALGGPVNLTSYRNIEQLVALIPSQAPLAAAPSLFTFVATDLEAYPLYGGMNYWELPNDLANRTQYLFTYLAYNNPQVIQLEAKTGLNFSDPSEWGIRAWTTDTNLGPVTLLEKGFTGRAETIGSWRASTLGTFASGQGLNAGPAGANGKNTSSSSGHVVHTRSNTTKGLYPLSTGTIAVGPFLNLNAGRYELTANLSGRSVHAAGSSSYVNSINVTGDLAGYLPAEIPSYLLHPGNFTSGGWESFTLNFTLSASVPGLRFSLYGNDDWFYLQVNYVTLASLTDD